MILINEDGCEKELTVPPLHPMRCMTCKYRSKTECLIYRDEYIYYKLKDLVYIPNGLDLITSVVGCCSHSDNKIQVIGDPMNNGRKK